jgi:hypothetical protein
VERDVREDGEVHEREQDVEPDDVVQRRHTAGCHGREDEGEVRPGVSAARVQVRDAHLPRALVQNGDPIDRDVARGHHGGVDDGDGRHRDDACDGQNASPAVATPCCDDHDEQRHGDQV